VSMPRLLSLVILACCVSFVEAQGDACLPLDVVSLLRGDLTTDVAKACADLLTSAQNGRDAGCSQECFGAVTKFQGHRCYPYLTQPQQRQTRWRSSSSRVALQGIWYGLYPASGVDLIEVVYDNSANTLRATKLTGNQFVRAGRVSWEVTPTSCKVVSSLWAGSYTPRWDPCRFTQIDADHFDVALPLEGGGEEVLTFVRATLTTLLEWDASSSPTFGFDIIFDGCGLEQQARFAVVISHQAHAVADAYVPLLWPQDFSSSWMDSVWKSFHLSRNTVILDQATAAHLRARGPHSTVVQQCHSTVIRCCSAVCGAGLKVSFCSVMPRLMCAGLLQVLLLFPLLLLGGWQLSSGAVAGVMLVPLAFLYCLVLCLRMQYLGFLN